MHVHVMMFNVEPTNYFVLFDGVMNEEYTRQYDTVHITYIIKYMTYV
jgi:hypothetical protein